MSIGGPFDCYPPGMSESNDAYRKGYRDGLKEDGSWGPRSL